MKLSADHIFHIGSQHLRNGKPCQDYATSGLAMDGGAFAIVSDGCSSGGKTEVGAQVVALAARAIILNDLGVQHRDLGGQVFEHLDAAAQVLSLTCDDMLATLVAARFHRGEARVDIFGDGVAAFVYADNSMSLFRLEWANNIPQYLAYESDGFRQFIQKHGGCLSAPATTITRVEIEHGGAVVDVQEHTLSLGGSLEGHAIWPTIGKPLVYVAAFSDGVTQVKGVEWIVAVRELLSFKATAGEFAKRRMNAFLRDEAHAGNGPVDDIAYAVIHVEHDEAA